MAVYRGRRGRSSGHWLQGVDEVDLFIERLREVPRTSQRAVRTAIVAATQEMRDDMARRASWSSRIPGAVKVRASFTRGMVEIRVDQRRAPHARPFEGIGSRGTFRHPVFGHDRWVSQAARPFFFPAIDAHRRKVVEAVERAVIATLPER